MLDFFHNPAYHRQKDFPGNLKDQPTWSFNYCASMIAGQLIELTYKPDLTYPNLT